MLATLAKETDLVEKNKPITENISEQFRNLVGEKPTAQEPMVHIKRTIKYPKVSLPKPGEIYSEDAFRSFFPNDSKLEIDFDDVYNDWENYKQLPMKLIITLVYYTALLILSVFSVTNLIDITSVEIIRGFEFFDFRIRYNYNGIKFCFFIHRDR